jgi:hypothetical protein
MIKEGTSLVLAWKLHLQWLRGVFGVSMAIFGPYTIHQFIDDIG